MAKVPYPQYDKPGSKISPWTGKPYTAAEAADVHKKTVTRDRLLSLKKNRNEKATGDNLTAVDRRLAAARRKSLGDKNRLQNRRGERKFQDEWRSVPTPPSRSNANRQAGKKLVPPALRPKPSVKLGPPTGRTADDVLMEMGTRPSKSAISRRGQRK